ncbi:MAG: HAD-IA family hydrolase [Actinobacteria bacterium]|nr:HAD-IA family hydrolase [Actinomycetota bacterium]
MIEVVFFDAGETLLRPHPSFPELLSRVATQAGHPVTPEEVHTVQERLAPHLVELADECGIQKPSLNREDSLRFWSHLYRRLLGELGIEDEALVAKMYSTFSSPSSYKLFDDVLPALRAVADMGLRIGLISNFEEWLEEMLVELEVGHLFEISVISGLVGVEKPDPLIYEMALERAGVDARRAVHIGDSPLTDVEPSRSVGMTPVLLDRYDRYPDPGVARVTSLSEIPALLRSLSPRD